MICINLCGGTGNQLYQFALGRSLEQNDSVQFCTKGLDNDPARMYLLDQLGLDLPLVKRTRSLEIVEGDMRFDPKILDTKNITLTGYWQTEKYFKRVENRIRKEIFQHPFRISDDTARIADQITYCPNSTSMHIRRSDNLAKRALVFHGMLPDEYYLRATMRILEHFPNAHFFVFSDDPDWCKDKFLSPAYTVVDCNRMSGTFDADGIITKRPGGREVEDLYLMSLCRHAIIANSSFSWWGAYLGDKGVDLKHTVIAPKTWFVPNGRTPNSTDIVPERWITL